MAHLRKASNVVQEKHLLPVPVAQVRVHMYHDAVVPARVRNAMAGLMHENRQR